MFLYGNRGGYEEVDGWAGVDGGGEEDDDDDEEEEVEVWHDDVSHHHPQQQERLGRLSHSPSHVQQRRGEG